MTTTEEREREREREVELLKQKISQLVADNLELSSQLENDYNPNKPVRKLTLQEKLQINMGNLLLKYRIPAAAIKNIYCSIILCTEKEPEFVDLTFDNNRMYKAFYFVDLDKEKVEIEKGNDVSVNIENIPDDVMPELQHQMDIGKVVQELLE
jgi:hypothetical protein